MEAKKYLLVLVKREYLRCWSKLLVVKITHTEEKWFGDGGVAAFPLRKEVLLVQLLLEKYIR